MGWIFILGIIFVSVVVTAGAIFFGLYKWELLDLHGLGVLYSVGENPYPMPTATDAFILVDGE